MKVHGLYVSSSNLYYMIVEHDTSNFNYYAKVDMSSNSVQY